MSIFNKNSETPKRGKSRYLLTKKTFFNMSKINKVKPVLQRNGIKNSHLLLNISTLEKLA